MIFAYICKYIERFLVYLVTPFSLALFSRTRFTVTPIVRNIHIFYKQNHGPLEISLGGHDKIYKIKAQVLLSRAQCHIFTTREVFSCRVFSTPINITNRTTEPERIAPDLFLIMKAWKGRWRNGGRFFEKLKYMTTDWRREIPLISQTCEIYRKLRERILGPQFRTPFWERIRLFLFPRKAVFERVNHYYI